MGGDCGLEGMDEFAEWSEGVFGDAELGDVRRTSRLVLMAKQAARRPSGKVSEVYDSASERQGAYDFIESRHGTAKATGDAMARSTARRCAEHDWVYVPLDGTSVKVWDGTGRKNFGAIGTYRNGAKGLKVNNALALTPDGVPVGIAAQVWWSRPRRPVKKHTHRNRQPLKSKETQHLLTCIDRVVEAFAEYAPDTKCWFQMDRGCDAHYVLVHLANSGHFFTVRSQSLRRMLTGKRKAWVKETLRKEPVLGPSTRSTGYRVTLCSARHDRRASQARHASAEGPLEDEEDRLAHQRRPSPRGGAAPGQS